MKFFTVRACALVAFAVAGFLPGQARGEAMIQYFNTDWNEIAAKMPELAEAGYDSIWLPPPTKGSGGLSVGYDLWDRFDLGSKDQRGSVRTRYGTEAELLRLIEIAHRFGIRVYLDNIMNHNAFDVPGYNAGTAIDIYPGFVPEDFHLKLTQDGFYRKWDNTRDWNDAWQVQHLGLADLIDIAQEPGTTNENFGATEGSTFPKIKFVRHPNNPEYYCFKPDGTYVGFGLANGITTAMIAANPGFYGEYVQDFLNRSARWELDRTKADGLRLDAVKHVRADFFGAGFGSDKDYNDYGYLGQAQRQFNLTRGFNDSRFNSTAQGANVNLRESVFDTEKPRHNGMMFGEHLGEPPPYGDYFNVGMRLVDNVLRNNLNGILGNPSAGLGGLDGDGGYGFASSLAVMHAQSHDNDYAARRELQHALYFTRSGIGLIYTDGNHQAQTLGQSGGAFPRHANTNFLGQFSDPKIPNLLYIHNQFARGYQMGRWSDSDFVAYERIDKRENGGMPDADGVTLLFLLNDNYAAGQGRNFNTSFGHTPFVDDAYLYNYSTFGGGFYSYASNIVNGSTIVPPGGYFAFSWRNPEESNLWSLGGGKPITILQSGLPASTLTYIRKDGPDGDPNFNPYGVPGAVPGSYSYPYTVPRVTSGTSLSFTARTDGSAENILFELDGGVDLNGVAPANNADPVGKRDHPPGLSTDVFVGYEQPTYIDREGPEKFAAVNTARCTFGSAGAETYTGGGTTVNGNGVNPQDAAAATFVYHDPTAGFGDWTGTHPATQYIDNGSSLSVYAKTNGVGGGFRMFFYYTNDGTNPEGAGGVGLGTTQVAEMLYQSPNTPGGDNWWANAAIPRPTGTIKYKIAIYKTFQPSQLPAGATEVARKKNMMTTFRVANFNATSAVLYPHDDFAATQTGLSEGFHVLRARAFLNRLGRASIYNTFTQTFYYDTQAPQGEIKFPAEGDTIGGSGYGVVVRTDPSVTEVWYHIDDADASNDDTNTKTQGGNGSGFEPFTDSNANGTRDTGEPFDDLNGNGVWDSGIAITWVRATEVTPTISIVSSYPREWRFNYNNIPSGSTAAQIKVRLRELSSAAYKDFSLSDAAGHYTTLVRSVTANGPVQKMFVAFPPTDGQVVDDSYVMKVWFSKSLADGTTTEELINRFLIKIASSESGSNTNGVAQSRTLYSINYNVTSDYHELAYLLPNLYNDQPDFLHTIDVTYTPPPGGTPLEAFRFVKAKPVVVIKNMIVTPPEVDSDGKIYVITLPDVANPTPEQRTVPIQVATDLEATSCAITFTIGTGTVTLNAGSPTIDGSSKFWDFTWSGVTAGDYTFTSTVTAPSGTSVASRNAHVVFRQVVNSDPNKHDIDDDGLGLYGPTAAPIETTAIPLPTTNSETWVNGEVHIWNISGKTNPLSPDTDGDILSDGLELGWGTAVDDTNINTDTNGDGVKNFQPDLDPPIYNTTDNAGPPAGDYSYFNPWPYNLNNSRTDQLAGSTTSPTSADTEGDALSDGFEDRTFQVSGGAVPYLPIYNGRVDIGVPDGSGVLHAISHPPSVYNTSRVDRARVLAVSPNAVWLETDPNNADTDADNIIDGNEDAGRNGIVDLAIVDRNQTDINGNFVVLATFTDFKQSVTVTGSVAGSTAQTFKYSDFCSNYIEPTNNQTYTSTALDKARLNTFFRPGGAIRTDKLDAVWLETDPRRYSTSGDSLPDGWKLQYNLDPFDDGVIGHYNLRTGQVIANTNNGPTGDPDGDGLTNLDEFLNGSDPHVAGNPPPPPAGSITIGPGVTTTVGAAVNKHEFTDWGVDDLIALDPYDGDGYNFNQGDVYHAGDGFDSSRDLVAFYAHDGGATNVGGDGNFYFRVDLQDLKAYAEQGNLDIYVALNLGNPGTGEYNFPDQIDTGTSLKWQVVVASYQTDKGNVYVWDKNSATHSTAIGQDLTQFGVTTRDQNSPNGFKKAYYNSDLDAVEFSISRQALLDAGWGGDPTTLLYQVFTTRDGTQNSPVGLGDIGGRSDIRDSIRNDNIASDYYLDQPNISGANSVLHSWIGRTADNDRGRRVKVVSLIHGNQAIQPGSTMQKLINNGAGGGYYRALDAHQAFEVPLSLHLTPTFASSVQWATSATLGSDDGPAFNTRIGSLIGSGRIDLLGSTFSDHSLPYFHTAFNTDNITLARDFLSNAYGHLPSPAVLWTPERVSSSGVLQKVAEAGYPYTFVDQMRHVSKWFGRTSALGDDGYRLNQINGTTAFVINDSASSYLFQSDDNGSPLLSRQLLSRKSRAAAQDQVIVFMNDWETFGTTANADAYDKNIRWLGSRPWILVATPDQIINGEIDNSLPPDGVGDTWGTVNRGSGLTLANVAKDFVDHATEENYDNWYNGSALEESLRDKKFNIRTGVALTTSYGSLGVSGIINSAWASVSGIVPGPASMGLANLARAALHASAFETAFHDNTNNDLSKFSTGAYIYPDTSFQNLAGFSKAAQAHTREAAIFARVDTWTQAAASGSYANSSVSEQTDVDLDGENEYLLYNDRFFGVFERLGGRMTAAWLRDINTGYVSQVAGNLSSYAGSETEEEGTTNTSAGSVVAYRTSCFKDWFAKIDNISSNGVSYTNNLYTAVGASSGVGWKFTSSDGKIIKTITLPASKGQLTASYTMTGYVQLYVRFGLSPDLLNLMQDGQKYLTGLTSDVQDVNLFNNNPSRSVRAYLRFNAPGFSGASFNPAATDRNSDAIFDTVNMRNQAQTQQVEMQGGTSMTFALGFETGSTLSYDSDGDGLPDAFENQYGLNPNDATGNNGASGDQDGDGRTNLQEYILGTNPTLADAPSASLTIARTSPATVTLAFPTVRDRVYKIFYRASLTTGAWTQAGGNIAGTGSSITYTDDGSGTGSPPTTTQPRYYRLDVSLAP